MPEIVSIPDEGLGNSSYVVDLEDGRLLVLDPERDPTPYLQMAERRAATVAFAVETHLHADFVSGSRELAAKGAKVVASASSGLEFPHAPLGDGDELDLGGLTLLALATPGHTPEHLAYLLLDGSRPVAVFSGGSLLPGSVARTDLISPELAEPLARALYRSVTERLLTLPDDLAVYPTHGTGATFCAAAPGGSRSSTTIGQEKASNPLLSVPDEDAFVARLLAGYGSHPDYFLRLRTVNKRGPRLYGDHPPPLEPLSPAEVRALIAQGVEVVDARPIADFAAGHIPGSLSNQLRPAFATWIGWLVPGDRPLVFVLNDDQDRSELIRQCLKIGYENITGELGGGMAAWRAEGFDENDVRLVGPPEFARDHGTVLDVRQESEFAQSHVKGALLVELGSLTGAADGLPDGPTTLMCGHGERAMTAASLLARARRGGDLSVLRGGPGDVPGTLLAWS
ncbi:MAG TPA: MBL fold metallo-hydrolase [Actinomycetota bacterium]|nr:MBL fold metallo-hydrolase [Actinomycetota bacterium]